MDQLLQEFLGEAEELIEVLNGDLQTLRARRGDGRARRELVARIFRHVHTLKGSSASVELEAVMALAHEFETLLDGARLGRVSVDDAVLDTFEDGVSALSEMLRAAAAEDQPSVPRVLIERLRRLAYRAESVSAPATHTLSHVLAALPEELARSLSEYEEHRLQEALSEGAHPFIVEVNFDLNTFDERFRDLSDALGVGGELISTLPGMESAAPDQINFRIVYATENSAGELATRLAPFGAIKLTSLAASKTVEEQASVDESPAEEEAQSFAPTSIKPLTTLVRVEVASLDGLIALAQELSKDTARALELALSDERPAVGLRAELELRGTSLRRRFALLEEKLTGLRLVPLAQTFARAMRAGRMAARTVGKEIDFETSGGDVLLDKSLSDAIADPLLHLLRNAVDHGIESPSERAAAGKSDRGQIKLEAIYKESRVRLRIMDDGRGIDTRLVAQAARERGMIDEDAPVSDEQALRLLFAPGFTTAATVSNVSGRGVGLDVVERAIEQVGGEILIESEAGAGTTFELLLPTSPEP